MDGGKNADPSSDAAVSRYPSGTLIVFAALQGAGWLAMVGMINVADEVGKSPLGEWWVIAVVYGVFLGKLTLGALATVLGPWNLLVRLTAPPIWFVGEVFLTARLIEDPSPASEGILVGGLMTVFWLVLQLPMWLVRTWSRSRLRLPGVAEVPAASNREQFSIAQILGLTFAVAAVLGIGKALIPEDEFVQFVDFAPGVLLAISAILLTAAVNGIVVYSFVLEEKSQARGLVGIAFVTGLLCGMLYLTLTTFGAGSRHEMLIGSTAMIAGQTAWMLLSLWTLRSAGWRLMYAKGG